MLTENEMLTLSEYNDPNRAANIHPEDAITLARAMLRLFPPGWDDPVTPERLVELGGELEEYEDDLPNGPKYCWFANSADRDRDFHIRFELNGGGWKPVEYRLPYELEAWMQPRNMHEARQLLVRCGAIKETK